MATYYINPLAAPAGDGLTRATAFQAFTNLPVLAAGDIVNLKPGSTITLAGTYTFNASGSSGNPIIIRTDPDESGAKAVVRPSSQSAIALAYTSRSDITTENVAVEGLPDWTGKDSVGFYINGGGNRLTFTGCDARFVGKGFSLDAGFARSGLTFTNCSATYCIEDGFRWWSSATTNTWSNITIQGGNYSYNGTGKLSNGSGIIFYIYLTTHTTQILQNVTIDSVVASFNNRAGISVQDEQYTLLLPELSTTPPTRNIQGVVIRNNETNYNQDSGIILDCAVASATLPLLIENNDAHYNGKGITRGAIWTAANLNPIIQWNRISHTFSNGTTVGDGQGIFDDMWNDGCICRWNIITNGEFQASFNPEYTAYGIGIYRCANSTHYGNLIVNCRYGYIIGTPQFATAPTFTNIRVFNNTFVNIDKSGIIIWFYTPAGSVELKNNAFMGSNYAISAEGTAAGTSQTIANNYSSGSLNQDTGSRITPGGVIFSSTPILNKYYRPVAGSSVIGAGQFLGIRPDLNTSTYQILPSAGAYEYVRPRTITTTRALRT